MNRLTCLSILASACIIVFSSNLVEAQDTPYQIKEIQTVDADSMLVENQDPITITEWWVPWENTRPRDPYVGPDGTTWFVGQNGNYAARFNPDSRTFTKYPLPPNSGPHNLIVDKQGMAWIAGNLNAFIGKLNPTNNTVEKILMPNKEAEDPHTLRFGKQNEIWFTVQGGNFIGRLYRTTKKVELIKVPTSYSRPYGLVVDDDNRPWICLLGTNKLATVDPATMKLEEITLERENARPRRITRTSDGMIWFVDYNQGYLMRLNPKNRSIKEWSMPAGRKSYPYGMTSDHKDRIWIVETGPSPNIFVGFNTQTEEFFARTPIGSGGGTIRNMVFHEPTKTVWFGTDTNFLGRADVDF